MHGTQDRVARRVLSVMIAAVLLGGPFALSRGEVLQSSAVYDGLIFVPLALTGGAFGLLRAMRRPAPRDDSTARD